MYMMGIPWIVTMVILTGCVPKQLQHARRYILDTDQKGSLVLGVCVNVLTRETENTNKAQECTFEIHR